MKQGLKNKLANMGLTWPVIIIALIVLGVLIGAAFVPGNAIYDNSLGNKVGGYGLLLGAALYAFKSGEWFDFIKSDRIHEIVQILGTLLLLALGLIILVV